MLSSRAGSGDGSGLEGHLQRRADRPGGQHLRDRSATASRRPSSPWTSIRSTSTLIPANVDAKIVATTVFGNKYVSLTSPKNPTPQRITPQNVIDAHVGDDGVQHAVPDDHLDRREGGPGQGEPDAERGGAGVERVGRQVRAVDRQRQRHPRRRQSADADRSATTFSSWPTLGDTYANAAPDLFDFLNNAVDHGAHAQRAAKGSGRGVAGGGRVRQHRRRHLQPRRAVPGTRGRRSGADRPAAGHLQPGDCSAPSATSTTSNPRSPRSPVATATRCDPTPNCCPGWDWL